jgi:hypothetical protein
MNFTKTKKVVAAGLSALMMMTSTTSVFAAESGDKSTTLNYQVSSSYDWIIHSSIDFGADAGVGKTVDRTGNQVKVLKNVIPEGKYLNISVKGSGANDAFTVDNGGSEVLNYDVSDDNGAVGVNGNVLSVPAGTNTATQNMNFKLNTTKKSAEVAGQYTGRVIYNASVGDKNGGTTSGTVESYSAGDTLDIEGTKYIVLEQKENNQALVMTASSIGERAFQSKTRDDGIDIRTYEGSEIDNYLENDWYNNLSPTMKNAIQMTDINQIGYYDIMNVGKYSSLISQVSVPDPTDPDPSSPSEPIHKEDKIYNKISRHVYLPSIADIGNVVELNNLTSIRKFLNGTSFWTRDHSRPTPISNNVYAFNADSMNMMMLENTQTMTLTGVRPAFVIDLSQVNYSVVK